jgi:flagellar protein FliJ
MSRTQRFETILKVSELREQDAARVLAEDELALQHAKGKLQELVTYQTEYAAGLSKATSGFAIQLRDGRLFLDRLNKAIGVQRQQIERHGDTVEASKQKWQDARKQMIILNKFTDKARVTERITADKRDQKWLDELAGAAYARSCAQS